MHNAVNKKEVGSTRVVHPVLVLLSSSLGGDIGASWARLKRQRHAGIVDRVDHLFGAAANRSIADLLVQGVYGMLEYIRHSLCSKHRLSSSMMALITCLITSSSCSGGLRHAGVHPADRAAGPQGERETLPFLDLSLPYLDLSLTFRCLTLTFP